jgi:hypothetical protein
LIKKEKKLKKSPLIPCFFKGGNRNPPYTSPFGKGGKNSRWDLKARLKLPYKINPSLSPFYKGRKEKKQG